MTAVIRLYLTSDATSNATKALVALKNEVSDGILGQMAVVSGSYNASYIRKYTINNCQVASIPSTVVHAVCNSLKKRIIKFTKYKLVLNVLRNPLVIS